jgi:hypothetical protein
MSIWSSAENIGETEDERPDSQAPVLTYWEGFGNHYPAVGEEFPGAVGIDHLPAFCAPGAAPDDDRVAPWLRLCLLTTGGRTFNNPHGKRETGRPMIRDGGRVVMSRAAVQQFRNQLTEWLDLDYLPDDWTP